MEQANGVSDLTDVVLTEDHPEDKEVTNTRKRPKRVLQFSDGVLEEYSSDDERDAPKEVKTATPVDPRKLDWLPWAWYRTTWAGEKVLNGCDYVGECLASFFGITSPKYQFEINEFYRLEALENERRHREDLEMGGWNDQHRNNLINSNTVLSNNHN